MSKDEQAVNEQVDADTTATDSAAVENETSEVVEEQSANESGEYSADDVAEPEEPEQSEETEEATEDDEQDDSESQDDKQDDEQLAPKSVNRFQQLANENRALREQLAQLDARKAQLATEQELLNQVNPDTGDYYTVADAERISRVQANEQYQQQIAQQQQDLQIQQNRQTLVAEANQTVTEFPELDSQSDKFDPEIAQVYEQTLQRALILDQQGNPIGAHLSPYQLAQSIVSPARRAAERAKALGQADAQKATRRMLASADPSSGSSSGKRSFETMDIRQMEAELRRKGHDI